ncbi:MAG TPA: glycosyltransferase family 2 protein [Candidatus Bathyarchaeia archaeon]|nr:glycosyltransferase family 2 protein [Candidatus Bathyarchaeia archaeon]
MITDNQSRLTETQRKLITVVLPTKNEESAIGPVIDEVMSCGYNQILVVDGSSADRTVEIAKQRGVEVVTQIGKGKRDAVLTALKSVRSYYCMFMDADMTYDAHDIDGFLKSAEDCDQVLGVRHPQPEAMSRVHKFGNRVLTATFNLLFGVHLSDVLSGMYLIETDFARSLKFGLGELTVEQEILAQSTAMGRVTEIPINYRKRLGISKTHTWRQGMADLLAMLSIARRYSPVVLFSLISALALVPALLIICWMLVEVLLAKSFDIGYTTVALFLFMIGALGLAVSSLSLSFKLTLRQFERRLRRHETVHPLRTTDTREHTPS